MSIPVQFNHNVPISRANLKHVKRVLIKIGTSVVINGDGRVALGRLGHIVEQIVDLLRDGKEVVLVSSGAVGVGNLKIQQNLVLSMPLRAHVAGNMTVDASKPSVCAATGQSGLMALYEMLFGHKQISCSQILLTELDLRYAKRRANLTETISTLLSLGIVPIVNENDVIGQQNPTPDEEVLFWDNDSLACLLSKELNVELMIILSDVEGIYKRPPTGNQKPEIVHTFIPGVTEITVGNKSKVGRGGMQSKIESATTALDYVHAVVIASGYKLNTITEIIEGKKVGTLLATNVDTEDDSSLLLASRAKVASRILQSLTTEQRTDIIIAVAESIKKRQAEILEENLKDIKLAESQGTARSLVSRLKLTSQKIDTLVKGLIQLAKSPEPLGKVLHEIELAPKLLLKKETVPLGLLLVIFESRPDVLPQVAGLALKSGNGLLLKGGKEASHSNKILHEIIVDAVHKCSNELVPREIIGLVETREEVKNLLALDEYINLVIPRGSSDLVRYIQQESRIPVLGHSEGICHIFIDEDAPLERVIPVVVDAKTDYPSACNAIETLLIHERWPKQNVAKLLNALESHKVELFGGNKASILIDLPQSHGFKTEYGDLGLTVEFVSSIEEAVNHINTYGSGHTDSILTDSKKSEEYFFSQVDSACVFSNSSTRFADGFRFGLGAEVGISTSKIHARGPVGIEGLLSTKWKLRSSEEKGSIASEFNSGEKQYTHKIIRSKL